MPRRTSTRHLRPVLAAGLALPLALGACSNPLAGTAEPGGPKVVVSPQAPAGSTGSTRSSSPTSAPAPNDTGATADPTQQAPEQTLLDGLDRPWDIAPLPDGRLLVSERNTGDLHLVPAPGSSGTAKVVGHLPIVRTEGEGGLLGLAIPEDFDVNPVFYAYYSAESDNRIVAVPWTGDGIGTPQVVFSGIPLGRNHNGGRIAFGPDGFLYVTTGESGDKSLSQKLDSLGGKILRITPEGEPAPGNPFGGSPIWSYGHRNVEGIAWDDQKRLWASEFGANTWDELNLITPGGNYGWPAVEGISDDPAYVDPVVQWKPSEMSPSGITIGPDGAVYLAALRGESVWRVPLADGRAGTPQRLLQGRFGRLRDVRFVDDRVLLLTNNGETDRLVSLPLSDLGVG
ncbi:MAG: PQQ-dependent sugar dehydrogenase [Terracoccus sp.]